LIRALLFLGFALLVAGCDYVPKGSTLFHVEGDREYEKAQIAFPPSEGEKRLPLKLRWVDTNAWLTTATFAPGKYMFSARTGEGGYYSREVMIDGKKNRYDLPAAAQTLAGFTVGPKISGQVSLPDQKKLPTQLVIIFVGNDVTVRRVNLQSDRFTAEAPVRGRYKVEIHATGEPPRSFITKVLDIKADMDLGKVELQ
jgi:hypothetical protein